MDMRAVTYTALSHVLKPLTMSNRNIEVILFWNKRGHCMKVLIHDGLGIQSSTVETSNISLDSNSS
jgi:hypothetical protein